MLGLDERRPLADKIFSWPGLKGAAGLAMLMAAVFAASSGWLSAGQRQWLEWVFPIAGAIAGDFYFGFKTRRGD